MPAEYTGCIPRVYSVRSYPRRPAVSSPPRLTPQIGADGVEVAQALGVRVEQARRLVVDPDLGAVALDDRLRPTQVGRGHGREEVVLDLIVQAAQRRVD